MKVSAIVPALNEEKNIANVLKVLLNSKALSEVILVDGGSKDKTAEIGKAMGAKVLKVKGGGKGYGMLKGAEISKSPVIVFFDADLVGLKEKHILQLISPVVEDDADMVVGIRERWAGLPLFFAKIDPLLAIGGERALKRSIFLSLPKNLIKGFAVETTLNFFCLKKKLRVKYVELKGLNIITKERKQGVLKGLKNRFKMIWEMLKVRFLILININKF